MRVLFAHNGHIAFDAIVVSFLGAPHAIMTKSMLQGSDPIEAVFVILVLLFSIVAHEVSHGYAALALGDKTALYAGRLTLNPLKHIDPIGSILVPIMTLLAGFGFGWAKPVPYNPAFLRDKRWGDTKVALAGPLTNFGIALVFAMMARFFVGIFPEQAISLIIVVVWVNIALGVFNMIPVPPFDGSKLLLNLLPYRYRYVFDYMERYWFAILLIIVLFAGQIVSPLVRILFSLFMGGA